MQLHFTKQRRLQDRTAEFRLFVHPCLRWCSLTLSVARLCKQPYFANVVVAAMWKCHHIMKAVVKGIRDTELWTESSYKATHSLTDSLALLFVVFSPLQSLISRLLLLSVACLYVDLPFYLLLYLQFISVFFLCARLIFCFLLFRLTLNPLSVLRRPYIRSFRPEKVVQQHHWTTITSMPGTKHYLLLRYVNHNKLVF